MIKFNISQKWKKRLFVILSVVVCVGVVLLSIPKEAYQKIFGNTSNLIEEPSIDERPTQTIYVMSKQNELVGLNIKVDEIENDVIKQKWDLLTTKVATYPMGYYSPVETSTVLNKYEILQNKLTLSLSEDFLNSEGKNALASIAWTFCNDDIDEVVIKVNNEKLTVLKDYCFSKIDRTINVNYIFETSYLFEAEYMTVVHKVNDMIKPVTYFFEGEKTVEYVVSKLLESHFDDEVYKCQLIDKDLTIDLATDVVLTTTEIEEIKQSVMLNFDLDTLVINNNVMTIYEETFVKVENETGGSNINQQLDK